MHIQIASLEQANIPKNKQLTDKTAELESGEQRVSTEKYHLHQLEEQDHLLLDNRKRLNSFNDEFHRMKENLEELQAGNSKFLEENEKLHKSVEEYKREIEYLRRETEDKDEQAITKMQETLQIRDEEKRSLQTKLSELEHEKCAMKIHIENSENELKTTREDIFKLNTQLSTLSELNLETIENDYILQEKALIGKISNLEQRLKTAESNLESHTSQLIREPREKSEFYLEEIRDLTEQNDSLSEMNSRASHQFSETKLTIEELNSTISRSAETNRALQSQVQAMKAQQTHFEHFYSLQPQSTEAVLAETYDSLIIANQELKQSREENRKIQEALSTPTEKHESLTMSNKRTKESYSAIKVAYEQQSVIFTQMDLHMAKNSIKNSELLSSQRITELQRELNEAERELEKNAEQSDLMSSLQLRKDSVLLERNCQANLSRISELTTQVEQREVIHI